MADPEVSLLLVDDEAALLDIGKIFLERLGSFSVTPAESAQEALRLIETMAFDVIVSDYQMPVMDGIVFLKTIRQQSDIPFILFTGKGREEVVIEAINSGADFYLQKGGEPMAQFSELAHKVRQAVERRKAKLALRDSERRLTDLINFLPDATFAIDCEGKVISWNLAIEKMTGVRAKDIMGKGAYEYAIPFYHTRRPILIDLVLHRDPHNEANYPFIHRDGNTLTSEILIPHFREGKGAYLWFTASPLYDAKGNIIGAIESIRDVTDRKEAENSIRAAEDKFSTVFRSSPDMISINELETGRFVELNDAAVRIMGFLRDEMIGRTSLELKIWVHPEDLYALIKRVKSQGRVDRIEVLHRRKNGEIFYAALSADTITFGGKQYLLTTIRDISALKRAQHALEESEERYRNVVEGQTEFISRFTPEGIHVFANEAYLRYFNKTREELIWHRFVPEIPQEDRQQVAAHFASLIREHPSGTIEHRIIMPDGSVRWQQWSDTAVFDENDKVIEYQSVGRDITERKLAEEKIHLSEERYRSLTEASPDLIFVIDRDDRVSFVNTTAVRMLGISSEQIIGMPRRRLFPDDISRHQRDMLDAVFATGKPVHSGGPLTFSGKTLHFDHFLAPIFDSKGKTASVLGISRELSRNEQENRVFTDSLPDIIYRADIEGNIVYMNKKGLEALEVTPEEVINKPFLPNIHPDDVPTGIALYQQLLETGEPVSNFEIRFVARRGKGRVFPVITNVSAIRDEQGTIIGTQGIAVDISDKKRAERTLRENEARLRIIIEQLPGVVWTTDIDLLFTSSYGAAMRDIALEPDQVIGKSLTVFYEGQPGKEQAYEAHRRALRGENVSYEMQYGSRSFVAHVEPLRDPDGNTVGTIGMAYDITGILAAQDKIRRSEELHRSLVSASPDGICITNREGVIIYASPRTTRLFGSESPDEATGRTIFQWLAPEERERAENDLKKVMSGMQPTAAAYRVLRKDKSSFMAEISAAVIRDASGGISGMVASIRDISDRIAAQEALRLANTKLNLLSSITRHDILNKLTIIQGFLALLAETRDPEQAKAYIAKINSSAEVIHNILVFTKDYQNMGVRAPEWIDAGVILARQLEFFDLGGIQVQNSMFGIQVYADPLFEKVMYNLIDNAIRYGRKITQIKAVCREEGRALVCTFEDDGIGIPVEDKERIFERGVGIGTGLGLFLARDILSVTGMTVRETGEPNRGARFEIWIPGGKFRTP